MTPDNALVKTAFFGVHNISHSVSLQEGKTGGGGLGRDLDESPFHKTNFETWRFGNAISSVNQELFVIYAYSELLPTLSRQNSTG